MEGWAKYTELQELVVYERDSIPSSALCGQLSISSGDIVQGTGQAQKGSRVCPSSTSKV